MTISSLKRFVERPPTPREQPEERCEMCATPIDGNHSHVVNVENRRLICTCRPCYILFTHQGAAGGKVRAVPERYRHDPGFRLDEATWSQLQIPVRTAFFFTNSHLGKVVAFYPSPAGATESLLDLTAWEELVAQNPMLADLEPDVEALLVHAGRGQGFDCYLVPINACYELVGRVRQTWRGFDGGEEAWREIDGFFAALRERSGES
jgi:hypothetical protein